mmetsp:Transcript_18596/g.41416  ORF Transcript_18596/g.41416 Transcript_18596/m.41416 type:complete len:707 (+) Transcript_18596:112-2232(+)
MHAQMERWTRLSILPPLLLLIADSWAFSPCHLLGHRDATCSSRSASVELESTPVGISTAVDESRHDVIGSTQTRPARSLSTSPKLRDAFLAGIHPEESQDELGRGDFIFSDWRRAWYTYGSCDTLSREEYESGDFVVDPFTGEADYEIDAIDGELPADLVGVLYRNGPGKFGVAGDRVQHILDADGLVLRFEFSSPEETSFRQFGGAKQTSRIRFTSRFVETEGFIEEREKKEFTKRGTFGTAPRGKVNLFGKTFGDEPKKAGLNSDPEKSSLTSRILANAGSVDIKNTSNTQVIAFGGKLLSLWEAGLPYNLDPVTLETIGQVKMNDPDRVTESKLAVKAIENIPAEFQPDFLGGEAYTAHPKMCPRTGHLVGWRWAQDTSDGSMEVTFTEYSPEGFKVVAEATHKLEKCSLAPHDMVLTENFVVLKINALSMDQVSFLSGAKGPAECLGMDGRSPVRAFVFPRPTCKDSKMKPFVVNDIPACFSIHFSHGYEDEKTGNIISYFSGWPPSDSTSFLGAWGGFCPDYCDIPETFYWRLEIDPQGQKCVDLRVSPGAENVCAEHPVVHPGFVTRSPVFAYAQCCNVVGDASAPMGYAKLRLDGGIPPQNLKVGEKNEDVDVFWIGSRRFAGEPLVVPKRGANLEDETQAYLLGLVYDAAEDKSSLWVFDLERDLRDGPVARIWLKTALPHGLHGCFTQDSLQTSCFC